MKVLTMLLVGGGAAAALVTLVSPRLSLENDLVTLFLRLFVGATISLLLLGTIACALSCAKITPVRREQDVYRSVDGQDFEKGRRVEIPPELRQALAPVLAALQHESSGTPEQQAAYHGYLKDVLNLYLAQLTQDPAASLPSSSLVDVDLGGGAESPSAPRGLFGSSSGGTSALLLARSDGGSGYDSLGETPKQPL